VTRTKPNLVLLDLRLKDRDSFDLIAMIKLESPGSAVLILSQGEELLYAEKVLKAGADGYIMKQEAATELFRAISVVLRGEIYLSPAMAVQFPPNYTRHLLRVCPTQESAAFPDTQTDDS
jgi:DNA-binding NarL/FixJ family response regulator